VDRNIDGCDVGKEDACEDSWDNGTKDGNNIGDKEG